ncbi:uncharacterized protein LOC115626023 [Scaptodrosophila lebanonensis]|uniref:Uncharacterized protein LOC115626023 n=1 Tax=Drosophila lebanonensis TaxID=7225 RepID=A0A6J2TQ98_DROLE|nr:uncharacterized protein LOC115626023 [Scaptodrosophila lebanonensis]
MFWLTYLVLFAPLQWLSSAQLNYMDLYKKIAKVRILREMEFNKHVYETHSKASLILFIDSDSDENVRTAQDFDALISRLEKWELLLSFFVFDCSHKNNADRCHDLGVKRRPELRFIGDEGAKQAEGIKFKTTTAQKNAFKSLDPKDVLKVLPNLMENYSFEMNTGVNFRPNEAAFRTKQVFGKRNITHLAVVWQPDKSTLGRDTILELLNFPVHVRTYNEKGAALDWGMDGKNRLLAVIDRKGHAVHLVPREATVEAYVSSIKELFRLKGHLPAERSQIYLFRNIPNVVLLNDASSFDSLHQPPLRKASLVLFIDSTSEDSWGIANRYRMLEIFLRKWQRLLSLFVFDCAASQAESCRALGVLQLPELYFICATGEKHARFSRKLDSLDSSSIQSELQTLLPNCNFDENRTGVHFQPLTDPSAIQRLFGVGNIEYTAVVWQPPNSTVGHDTILGLLAFPVHVRILTDPQVAAEFGMDAGHNQIVLLDRHGHRVHLALLSKHEPFIKSVTDLFQFINYKPKSSINNSPYNYF